MTQTPEPRFADNAQRYRLDSRIATGGMGEVWRATDTLLGRVVAVKVLKDEIAEDPVFRSRFETEARHAAALHHPGIASVFDVGERAATELGGQPRPFLVMELVEGQPLSALLRQDRDLDPDAVRDLMAQVGDALGAAHRGGIIHRDVKPANLIVTPDGKVKVTDFGIARAADGAQITQTGAVMGTPQYLSPEQAEGKPATIASDVYSLGVVSFECLAGRRPFDAESPIATALAHIREPVPALPDHVPTDLAAVIRTALSKDPADRYPDGAAFAAALRDPSTAKVSTAPALAPVAVPGPEEPRTQVLAATPMAQEPLTPTATELPRSSSRNATGPIVAAVVLLVALVIVVTLLLTDGDEEPVAAPPSTTPATAEPSTAEPSTEPTKPEPSEDQTITINEGDYLGRPVDDVEAQLRSLGLRVARNELDNDDPSRNGLVESLNPAGDVQPNDVIAVSYYGTAPEVTPSPPPSETPSPGPSDGPTVPAPTLSTNLTP
ncbi:MAG: protein kinase [Nocardioides sp.]